MSTKDTNSLKSVEQNHRLQDTKKRAYKTQKDTVFQVFTGSEKSMLEVSKETNVKRTTICGYVGQFRKEGLIKMLYKAPCVISNHKVKHFKIV